MTQTVLQPGAQPATQTIVVKIGTSSLAQPETGYLAIATIARLVETLCQLRRRGMRSFSSLLGQWVSAVRGWA
jgi:glutamate 5-kinase (EC 2.7.2.11)